MSKVSSREGLIARITDLLQQETRQNAVSYNTEKPYQSYERIGFEGRRWSVEKRIAEYGLMDLLFSDSRVLDIGSNFGFFVVEFARLCALAHGIEPNPLLNEIGQLTADFVGVGERVKFFDLKFQDFEPTCDYDVVFSLAAFFTADGRERTAADKYFGKINGLLAPNGVVFYESTSYTKEPDSEGYAGNPARQSALDAMERLMTVERAWETPSGSDGWFRQFAIGRKK